MRTSARFIAANLPNGLTFSCYADDAQQMYDFPIVVPFATMAYNSEDGWFMIGAYLTREEAEADIADSQKTCPTQKFMIIEDTTEMYVCFGDVWYPGINEKEVYAHVIAKREANTASWA